MEARFSSNNVGICLPNYTVS